MRLPSIAFLSAAALLMSACINVSKHENERHPITSTIVSDKCPFELNESEMQGVECGVLIAAENRNDPTNRRKIQIPYAIFHANGPSENRRTDSLLFIPGGPGTSIFREPRAFVYAPARSTRNIIAFEQRGNASSTPSLECQQPIIEGQLDTTRKCFQDLKSSGIDLSGYDTQQSVQDVADLFDLLNVAPWNIIGISYGSYWARAYAAQAPQQIRSMVLDSPMLPETSVAHSAQFSRRAFINFFDVCERDPDCATRYPSLEDRFISAVRRLEADRPSASGIVMTGSDLFGVVYRKLYSTKQLGSIPRTIDLAADADYSNLFQYTDWVNQTRRIKSQGLQTGTFRGSVYLSVLCRESPASSVRSVTLEQPTWPSDIAALSRHEAWNLNAQCDEWRTLKSKIDYGAPSPIAQPTLILTGQFDPIAPRVGVSAETKTTHVIDFPLRSHGILLAPTPCALAIIDTFLEHPEKRPDDNCTATMPSIIFD